MQENESTNHPAREVGASCEMPGNHPSVLGELPIKPTSPGELMARVDWLAFTVKHPVKFPWEYVYEALGLKQIFGELVPEGHGARGYSEINTTKDRYINVYTNPGTAVPKYSKDKDQVVEEQGEDITHTHFEITGSGTKCLNPGYLNNLYAVVKNGYFEFNFTRCDLAVDGAPFHPKELYNLVKYSVDNKTIKSPASREKINFVESPYQKREDGEIGTHTLYIGSKKSDRFLRTYNLHGQTRLEIQLRGKWAAACALQVLSNPQENWLELMKGYIVQYLDFKPPSYDMGVISENQVGIHQTLIENAFKAWENFKGITQAAQIHVYQAVELSIERVKRFLENSAAPGIRFIREVLGEFEFDTWVNNSTQGRMKKYYPLLDMFREKKRIGALVAAL